MTWKTVAFRAQRGAATAEMEGRSIAASPNDRRTDGLLPSSSDRDSPLELQIRRQRGSNDVGSAARPIELDDDDNDPMPPSRDPSGSGSDVSQESLWGHAVHVHDLSPGDQVYVYRGAIQHHGIVTHVPRQQEQGTANAALPSRIHVVHFDSNCDGVETTTLEAFLKGGTLRRATYSSSTFTSSIDFGASYACPADDPVLVITRANEAAKFGEGASGWSGYSLLTNNCETFACWCSTGRRQTLSRQATRGLVGAGVMAASVSAVASAGSVTAAAGGALAMVPRGVSGVTRTVKAVEWATSVAVVAISLADVASTLATRAPNARTSQNEI